VPLARARDYLSIGEVLDLLRPDFPDISISKIRFLEAEGLIAPERTGSKYRKFYEEDVSRLRHILALQRDQFLPLRVIKQRLADLLSNGEGAPSIPAPQSPAAAASEGDMEIDLAGVQMSSEELQAAAQIEKGQLQNLIDFGIMAAKDVYNENDLVVAKAACGFMGFGVEPRHLRMFKQSAEREASFVQQIVLPVTRRRDQEEARKQTSQSVRELLTLSRRIREALVQAALTDLL
jgi:DNA-binding transcriptional MerR regulator